MLTEGGYSEGGYSASERGADSPPQDLQELAAYTRREREKFEAARKANKKQASQEEKQIAEYELQMCEMREDHARKTANFENERSRLADQIAKYHDGLNAVMTAAC